MISYTSSSYYVFLLIFISSLILLKRFISKSNVVFAFNLIFHVLFFYFDKKKFINLSSFVAVNFFIIYWVNRAKSKRSIINCAILLNLFFFMVVNYKFASSIDFFHDSKKLAFVGFSFVVFKFVSFYLDLRNGLIGKVNFVHLYNYITFFPAYLSGPLYRYQKFSDELESSARPDDQELFDNLFRFVFGAFKKLVIADFLYTFCMENFSLESAMQFSMAQKIFAMYLYALVLYLDFSGYSDMAISVGKMVGVTITENFNRPYLAQNIQDFWTRWHISFMNWLRDYVYYPFQMFLIKKLKMKNMNLATILSTMLIFIITGLWHGDQIHFLYYGLFHASCFAIFLIWKNVLMKKVSKETRLRFFENPLFGFVAWFLTMNYFVFGLSFFINKYQVFLK